MQLQVSVIIERGGQEGVRRVVVGGNGMGRGRNGEGETGMGK